MESGIGLPGNIVRKINEINIVFPQQFIFSDGVMQNQKSLGAPLKKERLLEHMSTALISDQDKLNSAPRLCPCS